MNTGTGLPAVSDKGVPRVRVRCIIWHTRTKPRTHSAVYRFQAGFLKRPECLSPTQFCCRMTPHHTIMFYASQNQCCQGLLATRRHADMYNADSRAEAIPVPVYPLILARALPPPSLSLCGCACLSYVIMPTLLVCPRVPIPRTCTPCPSSTSLDFVAARPRPQDSSHWILYGHHRDRSG